jgi:tetratricopeptide (TPR) repeat protein
LPVGGLTYLLAEALSSAGALEEGLATINDALSFNPHEVAYRPQGLLIRGGLRFQLGQLDLAEADFRDSIALARTTDAKLYELHAARGFARLLQARGDVRAAREVLEPICVSFRASADVPYVRDALAVLRELQAY